jgi:hypothetical protein
MNYFNLEEAVEKLRFVVTLNEVKGLDPLKS